MTSSDKDAELVGELWRCPRYSSRDSRFSIVGWVAGYELLFRDARVSEAVIVDSAAATATVMLNSLTEIGLPRILGAHTGWINASREFLLSGLAATVPPDLIGFEILEEQLIDDRLVAAVGELDRQGYRLALDDFTHSPGAERLLPLVDVVKLDILELGRDGLCEQAARVKRYGAAVLAEKIETHADHAYCVRAGCDLFTVTALTRARFCERAGAPAVAATYSELFTLGLFSVIDALLDTPIQDVLASIPFPQHMRDALIAHQREMGALLDCVTALERGDFDRARALVPDAADLYLESIIWATTAADPLFEQIDAAAA
jgi:c-di-GMP-related signal transduction protein